MCKPPFFFVCLVFLLKRKREEARKKMLFLFLLFLSVSEGMTKWQQHKTRELLKKGNVPTFTSVIDSTQVGTYAFTNSERNTIFIDASRFQCCPNSFINVMTHEIDHVHGRNHNNVTGDVMAYHLTTFADGRISEDSFTHV